MTYSRPVISAGRFFISKAAVAMGGTRQSYELPQRPMATALPPSLSHRLVHKAQFVEKARRIPLRRQSTYCVRTLDAHLITALASTASPQFMTYLRPVTSAGCFFHFKSRSRNGGKCDNHMSFGSAETARMYPEELLLRCRQCGSHGRPARRGPGYRAASRYPRNRAGLDIAAWPNGRATAARPGELTKPRWLRERCGARRRPVRRARRPRRPLSIYTRDRHMRELDGVRAKV
jgi:hypothetical protein